MPDADIIHIGLSPRYHKVYKQLCEGVWNKQYIGRSVLRVLKKDIQIYGDEPIVLISKFASRLERIFSRPLFLPLTDWLSESNFLDQLKRQTHGNKRGLKFAVDSCKGMLQELREVFEVVSPVKEKLISIYFLKIYKAQFEEPIYLSQSNYQGISQELILTRLDELSLPIEQGINELASLVANGRKVRSLSISVKTNRKKIKLDDDVLSL